MPTVLRSQSLRVVIYPNDHPPAHVHVFGAGWVVVVNLIGPEVREVLRCGEREAARAKQIVGENEIALMKAWRELHE